MKTVRKSVMQTFCFVHNGDTYYLTNLIVYNTGEISCWGMMNKEKFLQKVKEGWITIDVPDGSSVRIGEQEFVVRQGETLNPDGSLMFKHKWIDKDGFVADVLDALGVAKGEKSVSEECRNAYENYIVTPSYVNKELLLEKYLAVPSHRRRYVLGNMDLKDFPIRDILAGYL